MLFMVVEHFKNGDPGPVRERFVREGRMLPEGVVYIGSWLDPERVRCFQVMEAKDRESLGEWTRRWEDLVDFEVFPVLTSQEYWVKFGGAA